MTRPIRYLIRHPLIIAVVTLGALAGAASGVIFAYSSDLPIITELDDYAPETITRVHDRSGEVIGEFATQRRVIVEYDDIPEVLRQAVIAAEDAEFFDHVGFNVPRLAVTLANNILTGDLTAAGASTLTMQLARNITLGGEQLGLQKTWQRKLREAYYTLHIEKRYTKREIFALYCNQIWLGTATHAAHGVEAASRLYFGKSVRDIGLDEAALIAGILQSPSRLSPLVNPERARARRNYALDRMADEGYITREEADAASQRPVQLAPRVQRANSIAPYFIEEVRQHLEAEYGAQRLYEDGLVVNTTLDASLQRAANRAVEEGLRRYDKRHGFRPVARNLLVEGTALDDFEHDRWRLTMNAGDVVPAVVTAVDGDAIGVRFGSHDARIGPDGYAWTRRSPSALVRMGDLIKVRITQLDNGAASATLDQDPEAEASLIAIDNRSGQVLAMVGGYSFDRSKFNRATQAYRQLGSLFKGVLFAAAIDQGYTTTSIIQDAPVSYEVGPNQKPYEPTNYDQKYEGPITLRYALEKSRNVPAVWLMNAVGPEVVVDFARRLGFTSPIPPYLSVALGSAEATLQEVTSAYSAFPNGGVRMVPYQIERIVDREGAVLEEFRPVPRDAIRADTAYIMVSLMRGVVERGTGRGARRLAWPVGGKTGTMDEYTDAWFVGFDPEITVGVWVGYDEKRTLGDSEEGARVALPIWRDFMQAHIDQRRGQAAPEGFVPPSNIVFASVDPQTGRATEPWARGAIQEAFIAGTTPGTAFR
ncbi:MAG: PBP1A family penicillin-binding protein [Acidobacteria bacterium]|nr:PBP1A family penicillin-binding protein [Acidobacteriota bacterium]